MASKALETKMAELGAKLKWPQICVTCGKEIAESKDSIISVDYTYSDDDPPQIIAGNDLAVQCRDCASKDLEGVEDFVWAR